VWVKSNAEVISKVGSVEPGAVHFGKMPLDPTGKNYADERRKSSVHVSFAYR